MAEPPHLTSNKRAERAARSDRLAKALRENLRRRKEQQRAQVELAGQAADEGRTGGDKPTT
jgi:hypothetical protein